MNLNSYLVFDGRAEEAFKFYEKSLGGKILAIFKHADTPAAAHVPADWQDKIMHVALKAGNGVLMGSDAPPDRYKTPQGFSVSVQLEDVAEAERVFAALSEGGKVGMPIQQTFWAARFGMLTDRFGIPWMINCEGAKQ
ncbi:MAG: VOC family protein [Candidatus Solibacter sp.]